MIRLDIRFDALGKTDDIAVVSFQINIFTSVLHLNHVDGSDSIRLRAYHVEIADHFLLVRNGDVETLKFWI